MQSKISVVLEEALAVPDTGMLTASSRTDVSPTSYQGIAIFSIIILTIVSSLGLLIYCKRRTKVHKVFLDNHNLKIKRSILSAIVSSACSIAMLIGAFTILNQPAGNSDSTHAAGSDTLSITVEGIGIELSHHEPFGYSSNTIKVAATNHGYTLGLYADSANLNLETMSGYDTNYAILPTASSELDFNSWGIALTEPSAKSANWQSVPVGKSNYLTVRETTIPNSAEDVVVYYGANVDPALPSGTYSGVINYVAVANVAPCDAGNICYHDNGANSVTTMDDQSVSNPDTATLWASNFQRSGYGFAGWNTKADGTGTNYGPSETISLPANFASEGLHLYAKWIKSAGSLQSWKGCNTMNIGDVTALTDERDNDTYAVAKLKDGKCWMIENLRLGGANPISLTSENTAITQSITLPAATTTDDAAVYDSIGVDARNTLTAVNNMTTPQRQQIYSYGNYYSVFAALGANTISGTQGQSSTTSICPKGWHIPTGGPAENAANSEYWQLIVTHLNNGASTTDVVDGMSRYSPANVADPVIKKMFSYPNNFLASGRLGLGKPFNSGDNMRYFTSTFYLSNSIYDLNGAEKTTSGYENLYPGTHKVANTNIMEAVRCVANGTYTIKFDANGGEGHMDDMVVGENETAQLPENAFTKENHRFGAWTITPNSLQDGYYFPGNTVSNLALTGSTITLYVIWQDCTEGCPPAIK